MNANVRLFCKLNTKKYLQRQQVKLILDERTIKLIKIVLLRFLIAGVIIRINFKDI